MIYTNKNSNLIYLLSLFLYFNIWCISILILIGYYNYCFDYIELQYIIITYPPWVVRHLVRHAILLSFVSVRDGSQVVGWGSIIMVSSESVPLSLVIIGLKQSTFCVTTSFRVRANDNCFWRVPFFPENLWDVRNFPDVSSIVFTCKTTYYV